jgi:anti-sigma factor RsiW
VRCSEIRDLVTGRSGEAAAPRVEEVAGHLGSCPACARYAARLGEARAILARECEVAPGPGFARRVVARLPSSAQVLGWAALRALPAAIVLALAISAFGLLQTPSAENSLLNDEATPEVLFTYAAQPPDAGAQVLAPVPPAAFRERR